ncbi:WD40-repeat-containing domain protein [Lipomyces arxii]|uniref:WD40-repeat-containing domain protein n=1 Tax=Lipomyces arxii TaxID=56418 RepID=UPI0034CD41E8
MILTHPFLSREMAENFFRLQKTREYRETSQTTGRLPGSISQPVRAVAWNALGNRIAVVSSLHNATGIRIWNPDRPEVRFSTELEGHTGPIDCIAWDPTYSDRLVSCSSSPLDGTVKLWDAKQNGILQTFPARTVTAISPSFVQYTPDGKWIIICGSNCKKIAVLDATTLTLSKAPATVHFSKGPGEVTKTAVSFSGKIIAVAFTSGYLKLLRFDSETGTIDSRPLIQLSAHRAAITCIEFDPRGRYLALGSSDSLVSIWDLHELACIRTVAKSPQPVRSLSLSFDGAYLAVSYDGFEPIEIIHVETGAFVFQIMRTAQYQTSTVEWHPIKYWLAYSGDPVGLKIMGSPEQQR